MTHPNTKKIYEVPVECFFCVLSLDQAAFPAPSYTPVLKLIFLNEMSRTHCQQGKNTGPHTPHGGVGTKDEYKGRWGGGEEG
jgi:hypothetical protein